MKILVSWSTGKDSAWMLHTLRQQQPEAIAGLLTTTNEAFGRVAMHAVRRELLQAQADATDLPLHVAPLPWPCSNEQYEAIMATAVAGSGLAPLFPIWKTKSTAALAQDMLDAGLRATLTCVNPQQLDRSFAGRTFDSSFLADLPAGVDPCGENGEFHSFAHAGPMFNHPIAVRVGEIVDRDGFVFADLVSPKSAG